MKPAHLESIVYPQFFPAHWLTETCDIVHSTFPSCIRIGYVIRGDGGYSYLMGPEFRQSEIALGTLHESALRNLRALPMPELSVADTPGGPEAFLGESSDNFMAARILLPVVQRELSRALGDEFLLALPCRDWMFCWSKSQSPDRRAHNVSEARKIFTSDDYSLTPDILSFSQGGGFQVHEQQDGRADIRKG
jgi:hypothetical protein